MPEYTPETLGDTAAIVNDVPPAETVVTLLNDSSPVVV